MTNEEIISMKCVKTITVELNYNKNINISRVDQIRAYSLYSLRLLTAYIHVFGTMICGIPLITNVSAKLVKEFELGIKVDYDKVQEIKSAVALLRENGKLRQGSNGRKASLEKYI